MKTLSELGISKAPWGTYQTKKEVAVTTSEEGFGNLESALCRGPRRKSNARLIAASPKLYEALLAMVVMYRDGGSWEYEQEVISKAKTALAEAAGESEANDGK